MVDNNHREQQGGSVCAFARPVLGVSETGGQSHQPAHPILADRLRGSSNYVSMILQFLTNY